jgi:hypothetical protein
MHLLWGNEDAAMFLNRFLAGAVVVLIAGAEAPSGAATMICANVTSGASWQIKIDYGRGTVDANPARITDRRVSWHDAGDGGNYTLDRKSGDLTVIVASSTGGFILHHLCKPETPS